MNSFRILWADDQLDVQETLSTLLDGFAHEIVHVRDGNMAIVKLTEGHFDILILDLKMPPEEWGGLWLLREMQRLQLSIPTIVLSGEGTQTETIKALRAGASDYVRKDNAKSELAKRILEIMAKEGPAATLKNLISQGETPEFECKETLRWNIKAGRMDKAIEHAVAKTLAAFMNTSGGTLVVGVRDSGEVVGLEQDKFPNRDAALLHLDNIISSFLQNSSAPFARAQFVVLESKEVLKIDCKASRLPIYLTGGNGSEIDFYIRRQASTVKLKLNEAVAYIQQRFVESEP